MLWPPVESFFLMVSSRSKEMFDEGQENQMFLEKGIALGMESHSRLALHA